MKRSRTVYFAAAATAITYAATAQPSIIRPQTQATGARQQVAQVVKNPSFSVGGSPHSVAVVVAGDFNGDGTPDLAVANGSDNSAIILPGAKKGGFGAPDQQHFAVGSGPMGAVTMDVTGDTKLDLVVVNSGSNDVSVLVGDGVGGFKAR